jgi:hypothetical protein
MCFLIDIIDIESIGQVVLEGPDYEMTLAGSFETQPSLKEAADVSTKKSGDKYGKTGNDRIFENRL